jgi:hypothetical protein
METFSGKKHVPFQSWLWVQFRTKNNWSKLGWNDNPESRQQLRLKRQELGFQPQGYACLIHILLTYYWKLRIQECTLANPIIRIKVLKVIVLPTHLLDRRDADAATPEGRFLLWSAVLALRDRRFGCHSPYSQHQMLYTRISTWCWSSDGVSLWGDFSSLHSRFYKVIMPKHNY